MNSTPHEFRKKRSGQTFSEVNAYQVLKKD